MPNWLRAAIWLCLGTALVLPRCAHADYACIPKEYGGSGLYFNVTETAVAKSAQWVCPDVKIYDLTWIKGENPISECMAGWSAFSVAPALATANQQIGLCATAKIVNGHYTEPKHDAAYQAGLANTRALYAAANPPAGYVVTSTAAYPLNPDGSRSITPWPTKATLSEPCDCAVKLSQFGATFCKVPSLSATQTIVAGCSVKK